MRPDTLRDAAAVTRYDVVPSPTRSPIVDAGTTTRINVAHFMADLITTDDVWQRWRRRMPVIHDRQPPSRRGVAI